MLTVPTSNDKENFTDFLARVILKIKELWTIPVVIFFLYIVFTTKNIGTIISGFLALMIIAYCILLIITFVKNKLESKLKKTIQFVLAIIIVISALAVLSNFYRIKIYFFINNNILLTFLILICLCFSVIILYQLYIIIGLSRGYNIQSYIKKLRRFTPKEYLGKYNQYAFEVCEKGNAYKMTHILSRIINRHYKTIENLKCYKLDDDKRPYDLSSSYRRSALEAIKLITYPFKSVFKIPVIENMEEDEIEDMMLSKLETIIEVDTFLKEYKNEFKLFISNNPTSTINDLFASFKKVDWIRLGCYFNHQYDKLIINKVFKEKDSSIISELSRRGIIEKSLSIQQFKNIFIVLLLKEIHNVIILIKYLHPIKLKKQLIINYDIGIRHFNLLIKKEELIPDYKGHMWSVNMKLPLDFSHSEAVMEHYKVISNLLLKSSDVEHKRIHLFYDSYNDSETFINKDMTATLFCNLLLEYLLGIKSKVLIIKNPSLMEKIIDRDAETGWKIADIFLLDYALFFSYSRQIEEDEIKNNGYSFIPGISCTLCSDFIADRPDEVQYNDLVEKNELIRKRKESHMRDKVYVFEDPTIFQVFKYNFEIIWNFDNYLKHLIKKSNSDDEMFKKALKLVDSIQVLDFFEFWNYSKNHESFTETSAIVSQIFDSSYPYEFIIEKSHKQFKNKYQVEKRINDIIKNANMDRKEKVKDINIQSKNPSLSITKKINIWDHYKVDIDGNAITKINKDLSPFFVS